MRSSTLVNLLTALPEGHMEALDRFLASPYFNSNPTLLELFRLLQPHHPKFKTEVLSKENMYAALFPDKPFVIASMRNLMSKLTELIRKFMAQEKFEESPELQDRLLLQQYSKYKVEKGFNDLYKKQMKRLEKGSKMDRFQCLENYLSLEEFHRSPFVDIRNLEKDHMNKTIQNLDRFFVLSKIMQQVSSNSRLILFKEAIPSSSTNKIVSNYIYNLNSEDKTAIQLIQKISELQINPNKPSVQLAIENYKKSHNSYTKNDSKILFRVLVNLLTRIFTRRDSNYLKKIHLLYRFGIENGTLLYDNSLPSVVFINVVAAGAHSGEIAWSSRFIQKNIHFLPKEDQNEVKIYTESLINFTRKNYDKVNSTLLKIRLRNSKFGFHFRLLMMKNAIERALINPDVAIEGLKLLTSIEKFTRRKYTTKPGSLYVFLNFIRVAKAMLKSINEKSTPNRRALKKLMKPDQPIAARHWLLEKINSLKDFNMEFN